MGFLAAVRKSRAGENLKLKITGYELVLYSVSTDSRLCYGCRVRSNGYDSNELNIFILPYLMKNASRIKMDKICGL